MEGCSEAVWPSQADQKQDAREQRLCFKCGKPGHIKRDCPELQANTVQRVPADAKGDSLL